MKIAVLVDYDNLLETQKLSGVLDVVTRALMQLPRRTNGLRGVCEVRIYGGWYEDETMTTLAQQISVNIQNQFPTILRLPTDSAEQVLLHTTSELAVSLLEEPAYHLFGTYRKKGKPSNVRVQRPEIVGCVAPMCPLPAARKLIRKGKCPVETCTTVADDLVYRHEQKIVDTMLTCDLLYLTKLGYEYLILVSADDDFLPPIRTALLRGANIVRVHPQANERRKPISIVGGQLIELEL